MKYDISTYESWGPLLSADIMSQLYKKHGLKDDVADIIAATRRNILQCSIKDISDRYRPAAQTQLQLESWMLL
jgi:hypothetical protein